MTRFARLLVVPLALSGGCFSPEKASVYSPDPTVKIPAIASVDPNDKKAMHQMVQDLDSDDPAVRFYTIEKLRRITGKSFGYRYYDDEADRAPALKQWKQWLAEREGKAPPGDTQNTNQSTTQSSSS